jgi:putative oxidoreductase
MNFKTIAVHSARVLLGGMFLFTGLNGLFHFAPLPPPPEGARQLLEAFQASGYLLAFIKLTEVSVGALLLANRFVPLALTVLAPVMLNIVVFHAFLEPPQTLVIPLVLMGLQLFLAWTHRAAYAPLFRVPQRAEAVKPGALASPA